MQKIIIGTQNQAKIKQIAGALSNLKIEVAGLPHKINSVEENGATAEENAQLKALAYSRELPDIILSMDNALYLDGLTDDKQPGINVRRIPGRTNRPTDEKMLQYYVSLIEKIGEKIGGHWEFALCAACQGKIIREATIISPRIFVSQPSQNNVPGYPLESIQIDPKTGIYISDMTQKEQDQFWQKTIGRELAAFVKTII